MRRMIGSMQCVIFAPGWRAPLSRRCCHLPSYVSPPSLCGSFLGWEELDVIDPDADSAHKGTGKANEGLNTDVSMRA